MYLLGQFSVRLVRSAKHKNRLDSWYYAKSIEKSITATIQNSIIFSILTGIGIGILFDLSWRLFKTLTSLFL